MGECNIRLAKRFYRISVVFSLLIMVIQMGWIWFYQVYIFELLQHVKSEKTEAFREQFFGMVMVLLIGDYLNNIFGGVYRGLGK